MEQQKSDNPKNEKFSKSNIAFPLSIIGITNCNCAYWWREKENKKLKFVVFMKADAPLINKISWNQTRCYLSRKRTLFSNFFTKSFVNVKAISS